MLRSSVRPVGRCTTEDSPLDLPPARSLPFNTPVSKVNSFVPEAEKASFPLPGCVHLRLGERHAADPKSNSQSDGKNRRFIGSRSQSEVVFPLTPALSLGERGNRRQRVRESPGMPGHCAGAGDLLSLSPRERVGVRGNRLTVVPDRSA